MFSSFSALSVCGRGAARLAAVTLASGLAVSGALVTAGPAAADTAPAHTQGGATATIGGLRTYGAAVVHSAEGDLEISAGLFEMSVEGGGMLQTYCVDIHNPTQKDAKYHETPWSGTSLGANKDAGRIRWILQNSYPQVNDLASLAKKAGVRGGLSEQDAAAGTQVAIWRYSDGVDVDAVDPEAEKLADYLEKSARDVAEPEASLTLDPPALSGHPGGLLGPVTVHTNADSVTVTPPADAATSGVRIVGKNGKDITTAQDGSQLFFEVPADTTDGSAELTVQASTTVPVGRAFASETRSQTQILAGSSESTVTATASATWAETGAIPALSAAENCAEGGVDITAVNQGDEAFTFELMGAEHTIAAGETRTVTIPLQEDQAYDFTITGPGGYEKRFTGVLDCRTQADAASEAGASTQILTQPSPATVGSTSADVNLAATGSSDTTPAIAGVAIGLVVIGGAALVVVRKKKS
ncbi:TQXA domain-containing protein [Streptomyces spinoverrucosus]|uniref:TQXA domain-containing protein n=1 Tax=Streptomyces spinoverrucosus TaxID=284043 RepID=A0A4Y3VM87_9ACTN|nr:Cys-Gln thioester bond-forming surface protein [Streptomyces spinoverrucosus]GEC07255.1 TQXA domain-containing protein [Streptomyces spinoverrucosus]GHB90785.1 TQXA domain-containing protein [Streptomyces spinoverrucosus]